METHSSKLKLATRFLGIFLAGAVFYGCAHSTKPVVSERIKIKSVVAEVMGDRSAPFSKEPLLETMDKYEKIFDSVIGGESERKARTMHQRADLYLMLEIRSYQNVIARYKKQKRLVERGVKAQLPPMPKVDHRRSRKVYEKLLALYPDREENDRVLYHLARIYDDYDQPEKKIYALQELADRYPLSPLRAEAVYRLAETLYDTNRFRRAEASYEISEQLDNQLLFERSLYKLGWTRLGLEDNEGAIEAFVRLLDRKRMTLSDGSLKLDSRSMSDAKWEEVLEIIRGISLSFSYMGSIRKIQYYFESKGGRDYEHMIYRGVADQFMQQRRLEKAVSVYEAFIKRNPLDEKAPLFQSNIIKAYQDFKLVNLANRTRARFIDRFGESSLWFQSSDQKNRSKVSPVHRRIIEELAVFYHAEAQQTKRAKDYKEAFKWYRLYLKFFPRGPESSRINFLLAEGLYEIGRYSRAADEYERTAYEYALHEDSSEAGYAVIVTLGKMVSREKNLRKKNRLTLRLAEHCARFWKAFPSDSRVLDVLWRGAEIYYRAGKWDRTRYMGRAIVRSVLPIEIPSIKARRLIADSYYEERLYEQAAAAYQKLASTTSDTDEEKELRKLWGSAVYKKAEAGREAGNLRQAQTDFMRVHAGVPGMDVAAVALFDAGKVALMRNKPDESLQLFKVQLERYPKHRLNEKVKELLLAREQKLLDEGRREEAQSFAAKIQSFQTGSGSELIYRSERLIADHYFEKKEYGEAAEAYRLLAQTQESLQNPEQKELIRLWTSALYKKAEVLKKEGKTIEAQAGFMELYRVAPDSDITPVALYDAGVTAILVKDQAGVFRAFNILIDEYPSSTYVSHAAVQIADIYEQKGQLKEAARKYEFVAKLDTDPKTEGAALMSAARLYEKLEKWSRVVPLYKSYLDKYAGEYAMLVETTYKMASALFKLDRTQEAIRLAQDLISRHGKGDATDESFSYYIAKSYLLKADGLKIRFEKVKLVDPLAENLALKEELLGEIVEQYIEATEFSIAEVTTAASHKIGELFEIFGTALLQSERPKTLTPDQLEQ